MMALLPFFVVKAFHHHEDDMLLPVPMQIIRAIRPMIVLSATFLFLFSRKRSL